MVAGYPLPLQRGIVGYHVKGCRIERVADLGAASLKFRIESGENMQSTLVLFGECRMRSPRAILERVNDVGLSGYSKLYSWRIGSSAISRTLIDELSELPPPMPP